VQVKFANCFAGQDVTFKLIRPNEAITPALQTLRLLLKPSNTELTCTSTCDQISHTMIFKASEESTIAVLSIASLKDILAARSELTLLFTDVLLRRLHFATLPFAGKYLGMEEDILAFEENMCLVDYMQNENPVDLDDILHELHNMKFRNSFAPATYESPETPTLPEGWLGQETARQDSIQDHEPARPPFPVKAASLPETNMRVEIPKLPISSRTQLSLPSALTALEDSRAFLSRRSVPSVASSSRMIKEIVARLMSDALDLDFGTPDHSTEVVVSRKVREMLAGLVELCVFRKATSLAKQDQRLPGIYLIVDGEVMLQTTSKQDGTARTKTLSVGAIIGHSSVLANARAFADVVATSDVHVGFLPRLQLSQLREQYPHILFGLARKVLACLPVSIKNVHAATDYVQYGVHDAIYQEGDER
jgi:CRP-like cAMP-binding protein